nr:hypothetical protein [Candidatus Sigynarchaeota archaeon]
MNLLALSDRASISCKSLWTDAEPGETSAPSKRIIHERWIQLEREATLTAVGVRIGGGSETVQFLLDKCGHVMEKNTEVAWPRHDDEGK